jgi:hypothetical protein
MLATEGRKFIVAVYKGKCNFNMRHKSVEISLNKFYISAVARS